MKPWHAKSAQADSAHADSGCTGLAVTPGPADRPTQRGTRGARRGALWPAALVLVFAFGATQAHGLNFDYVEPGLAACPVGPVAPAASAAAPKRIAKGVAVAGRISVKCGFDQGSYTVSVNSSDPGASFSPKTFIVNFGQVVGKGVFAVTFATVGVQTVSATITSNMGSPTVRGHFASANNELLVVMP